MTREPLLTARDLDILAALDHSPLTVLQLLKVSQTFARPFTDERRVRERMQILCAVGRVRRWQYATAGQGAPNYYTLSPLGYQLLHGPEATAPTKRYFDPIAIGRQHHTSCLAEFIVHTAVAAHDNGLTFTGFYRENTMRLQVGDAALFPDCAFQLLSPQGPDRSFFVELDNRTERVHSPKDRDSWERKIRLYDHFQDSCPTRFRVLVVTTRGTDRLGHILDTAARIMRNPQRSLFYGISLPQYLARPDILQTAGFLDHRQRCVALVPEELGRRPLQEPAAERPLAAAQVAC